MVAYSTYTYGVVTRRAVDLAADGERVADFSTTFNGLRAFAAFLRGLEEGDTVEKADTGEVITIGNVGAVF